MTVRTLYFNAILDLFEDNRIPVQDAKIVLWLDLFEKNRISIQDAKIVLWTLLTAIYEDELIEEPQRREIILNNIDRQKDLLLICILGQK
jgi:hypothetical protein